MNKDINEVAIARFIAYDTEIKQLKEELQSYKDEYIRFRTQFEQWKNRLAKVARISSSCSMEKIVKIIEDYALMPDIIFDNKKETK